jgi:maltose O-acetyltransferase
MNIVKLFVSAVKKYKREKILVKLYYIILYYSILRYLPSSKLFRLLRYYCCKHIFAYCGKNVNIERMAHFNSGMGIEIGDNSGIGINAHIPSDTKIGKNVMMGPNCFILQLNHRFDRTDIPMIEQGSYPSKQTIIEDDVWIGRNVLFTPGRIVKTGTIIAAGTVLCKDFESYSIVGGNPSKLIRKR